MNSLFGHIILRKFSSQGENLATESLHYIISNSSIAKETLLNRLKIVEPNLNDELFFRTQVYDEDGAFPDLAGFDDENDQVCIIESKFWAGLTDNQPVTYIKRFNQQKPSLLLFLAPAKRIESLWSELKQRCSDGEVEVITENRDEKLIYGNLNDKHSICVIDWNSLLNDIEKNLDTAEDYLTKSDVIQLRGLCDQMDNEAFIPFNSEDISPLIAKRNIQFQDLVDNVVDTGLARKKFNKSNPPYKIKYGYSRAFLLDGNYYHLTFNNTFWNIYRNTPLWLDIYGKMVYGANSKEEKKEEWAERKRIRNALFKLESQNRLFFHESDMAAFIPIKIKLGASEEQVIESILEQIDEIGSLLDEYYEK